MRDADQLFRDLVNMNADEWNTTLAQELGMSVDTMRMSVSKKEMLVRSEDRFHVNIIKSKYNTGKLENGMDSHNESNQSKLSKYVIRMRVDDGTNDSDNTIEAFSCTGKIIIGMDFRGSDLSNSYFCDCVFYNCEFENCNMESSIFNTCIINSSMFYNANMIGVTFVRTTILDSVLSNGDFTTSNWLDSVIIGSQAIYSKFYEARLTGTVMMDSVFNHSIFRGVGLILFSATLTEMRDCDFREVGIFDSMFADVDIRGSLFNDAFATCVTSTKLCSDSRSVVELFDACENTQIDKELMGGFDVDGPDVDGGLEDTHA